MSGVLYFVLFLSLCSVFFNLPLPPVVPVAIMLSCFHNNLSSPQEHSGLAGQTSIPVGNLNPCIVPVKFIFAVVVVCRLPPRKGPPPERTKCIQNRQSAGLLDPRCDKNPRRREPGGRRDAPSLRQPAAQKDTVLEGVTSAMNKQNKKIDENVQFLLFFVPSVFRFLEKNRATFGPVTKYFLPRGLSVEGCAPVPIKSNCQM